MTKVSNAVSPIYWNPGPWLRAIGQLLTFVAIFAGMAPAMRLLRPLARGTEFPFATSLGLLLALVLVAVVIHELGHYLAARWQGMGVMTMRVGPVTLMPQRGRRLWSWSTDQGWMSGGVMAFPALDQPFRRQMVWFVLGGSLANLAAAALAAGIAWWLGGSVASPLLLAFAIVSALLGLVNLLPAGPGHDGSHLVRLWRGLDLGQPGTEAMELNMRAFAGETADEVPEALLQGADREAPPLALWFRIFAALNRQDWDRLRALGVKLEDLHSLLDRTSRQAWTPFMRTLRSEVQFGLAMQGGVAPPPPDAAWIDQTRRLRPGTVDRHEALGHALAGRIRQRDDALARAEREAEFIADAAARKTEARMRQAVREIVAENTHRAPASACVTDHTPDRDSR